MLMTEGLDDYLICGLVPYQIVDKDFSGRFVGYLIKWNDGLLTIGTTVNICGNADVTENINERKIVYFGLVPSTETFGGFFEH